MQDFQFLHFSLLNFVCVEMDFVKMEKIELIETLMENLRVLKRVGSEMKHEKFINISILYKQIFRKAIIQCSEIPKKD